MSKVNQGYIIRIRQSRSFKGIVVCMLLNFIFEIVQPTSALALTEGPSQPEVQSFEPVNTTQMVDLFTGDFNYNIPLFNLPGPNGGYPVNLAYHAGLTPDDEASWVGLGWNINVGSLNRQLRGIPDEFKSELDDDKNDLADENYDYIEVKSDIKQNWTLGVSGALNLEIAGADLFKGNINGSVYYNNYRGVGSSFGFGVGFGKEGGITGGLGLSLDSENGMGVNASLGMSHKMDNARADHSLSVNFNGELSLDYSLNVKEYYKVPVPGTNLKVNLERSSGSYGSGMSFARNNFNPASQHRYNNYSLTLGVKGGPEASSFFVNGYAGVFFNTQDMSDEDKKGRKRPVVGYAKAGSSGTNSEYFTRDFTCYNEGQLTKASMFLPYSVYNYDAYQSSGQGLSGWFRPRRADIGRTFDPKNTNNTFGVNVAVELGAGGTAKFGVDGGVNFGYESQGSWDESFDSDNDLNFDFESPGVSGRSENLYYQANGEMTVFDKSEMDYIDGFNRPDIKLDGRNITNTTNDKLQSRRSSERVSRNTLIHNLKNKEVEKLGEFDIKYFTTNKENESLSPSVELDRETRNGVNISNHPAGYKILNDQGSYYVYGLPAYNQTEIDNVFSVEAPSNPSQTNLVDYELTNDGNVDYKVNGTHKYINKTTKSPYAHSYLLTSVQGADYVDVTNNGPTDDDLGYWVKFNYLQKDDSYKWRSPYAGAQYNMGAAYTKEDDKASYKYGEKELWYMAQIETKSHIAVFVLSDRTDMKEAESEHADIDAVGSASGLKIDKIKVYDKNTFMADPQNAIPLQVVHLEYDYELCQNSPNSSSANGAKLTLKKVWFTSNGSNRGALSKYEFDYGNQSPQYTPDSYDSWGNYKPLGSYREHHVRFPYTNQFNQNWDNGAWEPNYGTDEVNSTTKELTKSKQAELASAWCLKTIKLPSGGEINIDYESDDYGYVQHKTANQMFKIEDLGDHTSPNEIYSEQSESYIDPTTRRIYFKLEEPISATTNSTEQSKLIYDSYVKPMIQDEEGKRNLYFKTKMRLNNNLGGNPVWDYVSGYLPLENYSEAHYGVRTEVNGVYTEGFVTVQMTKKKNGSNYEKYHPMALAGWTFLQTNAQELLNDPANLGQTTGMGNAYDLVNVLPSLMGVVPTTAANFGMIRSYCKAQRYARYIELEHSVVRLASPDKIKYGGGHRVKQISMKDNWVADSENPRIYGMVYDYSKQEGGRRISSGVAQYEPQAGGDENALKYPIHYHDKQTVLSENNLFAEGPMNEAMFPGASVGYSQVTVRSLNTDTQVKEHIISSGQGRTGGQTVHEFYTAKDFPTIVETPSLLAEENNTKDLFNLNIPIPLIGSIRHNIYHGTQSFQIELNDMHGKPKSVKSYESIGYEINNNALTESTFEYQSEPIVYQGENVYKLTNEVKVINNDGTDLISPIKKVMGVQYDLFTDQKESKSFNMSAGLEINTDVAVPPPVVLPSFWINYSHSESILRTYTTNKVINRSGILVKTKSRDLQTVNESEVIAYDEKSGSPTLTMIKNEFGDEFYSYNIPAYYNYDGMGHAYQNINYEFDAQITHPDHAHDLKLVEFETNTEQREMLTRGDEVIVTVASDQSLKYRKGYFIGWTEGGMNCGAVDNIITGLIDFPGEILTEGGSATVTMKVIRSGRRNHYNAISANYLTKGQIDNPVNEVYASDYYGSIVSKEIQGNVLSATASLFKGDWASNQQTDPNELSLGNYGGQPSNTPNGDLAQGMNRVTNPFLTGNSGIWRPYKDYTYVGERRGNASLNANNGEQSNEPELFKDGVFESGVPMFSWEIGNMEDYVSNWEWLNEVTRFSENSYELENKNRLNIKSSALYGYDNSLTIGVGGNAGYFELGVEDFETSESDINWTNGFRTSQTNLNFNSISNGQEVVISNTVNVNGNSNSTCSMFINLSIINPSDLVKNFVENALHSDPFTDEARSTFGITLRDGNGKDYYFNGSLQSYHINGIPNGEVLWLTVAPFYHCSLESNDILVPTGSKLFGTITMYERRTLNQNNIANIVQSVTTKSHTGKRSLKIDSKVAFDQPMLRTLKDKKYIASYWVSRDNTNVVSYKPVSGDLIIPGITENGVFTALSSSDYKVDYGKIVEGWQKIDVEYSIHQLGKVIAFKFLPGNNSIYIDDFRVSPKTGGISTYVYDPEKKWLRATLNVDNYATLFFYDEEGNLTLKKQETEEGIFTITESRGHVAE
ncbi:MAG: hypothetical protein MK105_04810 [Crocinitomicaceae bacterium]|nr:hypothetical protein [Crocinitomicaceae bacterium]